MPLKIVRNDITKIKCDAIVNAAKSTLLGGGGVDGAIHKAAGKQLLLECAKLGGCNPGEAKVTKAYRLPCKYVIHTVGPKWKGGDQDEEKTLRSCYDESLKLAQSLKCESIAFPLIASGSYGYPKDRALRTAIDAISVFLLNNDMLVYIVIYDRDSFQISEKLFADITSFIDDKYVDAHFDFRRTKIRDIEESIVLDQDFFDAIQPICPNVCTHEETVIVETDVIAPSTFDSKPASVKTCSFSLDDLMEQLDESFSQMLIRMIDEKGMTDSECYKKANIDRKLFSKIRSDVNYRPSKATAIAFCISLELTLDETREMLMKAGYALSRSNKFDIIIEYFITNSNYNIFEINEALFAFDQRLLGA